MLLLLFNNTRALAGAVLGQGSTGARLAALRSAAGDTQGASALFGRIVGIRRLAGDRGG